MPVQQSQSILDPVEEVETQRSRIFVVDDDPLVQKLTSKILQRDDMEFECFDSANSALERLEESVPDLILSDIMMPGIDGIEFCQKLRQMPGLEEVPVIFFTGLSDMDSLARAYDAGASDYIVKPLRQVELLSRAHHHIDDYRRKQEAKSRIVSLNKQNESKTKFLGVASHDLRNPLVSIRGISQYLETEKFGPLNEGQRELVHTIVEASEGMLSLVEDLLDVSMFETGQMRLNLKRQPLEALVDQAVNLHSAAAGAKRIALQKESKADDSEGEFDRKLVSRVIDNLVSNAIKFSPSETTVRLVVESDVDRLYLKVEDEGPGIPDDEFDKLFKEFGRTSNLPTGGESSSGIGLYVCQRIAHSHGGEISAENRSSKGTRFTVALNRKITDE